MEKIDPNAWKKLTNLSLDTQEVFLGEFGE